MEGHTGGCQLWAIKPVAAIDSYLLGLWGAVFIYLGYIQDAMAGSSINVYATKELSSCSGPFCVGTNFVSFILINGVSDFKTK